MAQHDDRETAKQVRDVKKVAENKAANIGRAINDCLQSSTGREFLWELLNIGRVGTQPFNPSLPDPAITAFACGELNVGNQILELILSANPAGYVSLQQEQMNGHADPIDADPRSEPDTADTGGNFLEYPEPDSRPN